MKKRNLTVSQNNENIVIRDVFVAETFFERLKGLMFVGREHSFNLLLKNCNSVHTCFMRFNLDIFCLDKNFNVIKVLKNVKPFCFVLPVKGCCHILEICN